MDYRGIFMVADQAGEQSEACAGSFFAVRLDSCVFGDWRNKLCDSVGRILPVPFDEPLQHFYFGPLHVLHCLSNGGVDEKVATGSAMGRGNCNPGFGIVRPTSEDDDASRDAWDEKPRRK